MIDTAVVVCPRAEAPEAGLLGVRVAGLPLVVRTLLTARQGGVERFIVVASPAQRAGLRPQLEGDTRLQDRVRWLEPGETLPALASCLLLPPFVLLDSTSLRLWLARVRHNGMLTAPEAGVGPLVVPSKLLPACVQSALDGEPGLVGFLAWTQGDGVLHRVPWEGMGQRVLRAAEEVPALERQMIAALRSPEDGPIVDRFLNRSLSMPLSQWLVATPVLPNQITVGSLVAGLLGAWVLHYEGMLASLVGLLLFQFSVVLDHVDGEVARLTFQFTRLGKWLDNFGDHTVDLAVIASLTWRTATDAPMEQLALLGLGAVIGVTGAFLVVFWWSLSRQKLEVRQMRLARLLGRALLLLANRDGFSLALWATLLSGRPAWFLWALALGANAYWLAWLLIYGLPSRVSRT